MEPGEIAQRDEHSRIPVAFIAGLVIVALVIGGFIFLSRSTRPARQEVLKNLPFGAAEQDYAKQVHFRGVQMYRSSNLLNQEFTYVVTTISNEGARDLSGIEITLEFHDSFNQVDLRDSERVLTPADQPLGGGERRDFQVVFEHIPTDWNRQYPDMRITGLILK